MKWEDKKIEDMTIEDVEEILKNKKDALQKFRNANTFTYKRRVKCLWASTCRNNNYPLICEDTPSCYVE